MKVHLLPQRNARRLAYDALGSLNSSTDISELRSRLVSGDCP